MTWQSLGRNVGRRGPFFSGWAIWQGRRGTLLGSRATWPSLGRCAGLHCKEFCYEFLLGLVNPLAVGFFLTHDAWSSRGQASKL